MNRFKTFSGVLLAAVLGCTQQEPLIELTDNGTPYQVHLLDRTAEATLEIGGVHDVMEGDLRVAQIEVHNTGAAPFTVRTQCAWFDGNGFVIRSPANASYLETIPAGATVWLRSVAPSPKAASFRFDLATAY